MPEETQEQANLDRSRQPHLPCCGHCGDGGDGTGAKIASMPLQLGALGCVVIFCGNPACAAIHAIQVIDMSAPRPAGPPSNLYVPGVRN